MRLTPETRAKAIDELFAAATSHVLEHGEGAFSWHSFGARVHSRFVSSNAGRKVYAVRWERIPGRQLDPFSAYLVYYYAGAPGDESWLADLALVFGVPKGYIVAMSRGVLHRRQPLGYYHQDYTAGWQDGRELHERVQKFIELGRRELKQCLVISK